MIPERVLLHLGTHKTATTHLQMSLRAQSALLQDQDIAYIPLQKLRDSFTRLVWDNSATPEARRGSVDKQCDSTNLILSDENLLGFPREIRSGQLYQHAGRNLWRITEALPESNFRALVTLRSYADFFVSMYCEYLRHNPFITFRKFSRRTPVTRMSWIPLLNDLTEILGRDNVQVAFFEEVKADFQPLFNWFGDGLGPKPGKKQAEAWRRRATLSSVAIDTLESFARTHSPLEAKSLLSHWENSGEIPPGAAYSPFSVKQTRISNDRYRAEQARIRTRFRTLT
mgnify:FL=1